MVMMAHPILPRRSRGWTPKLFLEPILLSNFCHSRDIRLIHLVICRIIRFDEHLSRPRDHPAVVLVFLVEGVGACEEDGDIGAELSLATDEKTDSGQPAPRVAR